jgi:hypothetical protein
LSEKLREIVASFLRNVKENSSERKKII